jgi:hypothetical protein
MSRELIESPLRSFSINFRTAFVTLLEKHLKNISRQVTNANYEY